MRYLFIALLAFVSISAQAKIWRVNNNAGVTADFTNFSLATASASVSNGDTLYLEPSYTDYTSGATLSKRLVVIGPGYFLDSSNVSNPVNAGLQATKADSRIGGMYIGTGASGTRFLGVTLNSYFIFIGTLSNVSFEKVLFQGYVNFQTGTFDLISFRKCFFNSAGYMFDNTGATLTNFDFENNIFYNNAYVNLPDLSGSGNIFRNNSILNATTGFTISNTYVANNIFGTTSASTLTNCTIKNNIFQAAQTLPGTATNNLISQLMTNVFVGGSTGSLDSRLVLKPGSIAAGFGVTVGAVVSPDAGAYGATDPYKLSGIPNIPSIYALSVPIAVPSGTSTMNISFSTRNNN